MHVRRITSADEFARLAPDWNRLTRDVPLRSWEWLHAWWRHYGAPRELYLVVVEDSEGRLIGLAPWRLEQSAARGRVLKFLGSGEACTDYLSVLTTPEHEEAVTAAVAGWLTAADDPQAGDNAWDLLELTGVEPTDGVVAQLVAHLAEDGSAVHRRAGPNCWRIELPATWEAYVAELSKSHRKQVRRGERRLETPGYAVLYTATDRETLRRGMEILVDLHQRRQHTLEQAGCFASPSFSAFLHEAAENLLSAGRLQLHWLELAGRPAAAEFHLAAGGIAYAYQAGVEPELIDEEPGRLMNIAVLQRAISQGLLAFDFLRGDEPYKAHWRATVRPSLELRIVPRKTAAQLRHGAWLAGDSVKQWIKTGLSLVGMH